MAISEETLKKLNDKVAGNFKGNGGKLKADAVGKEAKRGFTAVERGPVGSPVANSAMPA